MSSRFILPAVLALSAFTAAPVFAQTASPAASPAAAAPATMAPPAGSPSAGTGGALMTGATRPAGFMTVNHHLRAAKVIGSDVYDAQNQKIGTVDDLLLSNKHDVTSVVLSVGGFLGIDSKLVKVPYHDLHIAGNKITMPNATRQELTKMPSYSFNKAG
ncbi:MAG: PRC-barrel domain-containing protein [Rhodospirillales bacterium]|nr:PRC-barrel domain-containing protein [Rhodospirillales bacterium]